MPYGEWGLGSRYTTGNRTVHLPDGQSYTLSNGEELPDNVFQRSMDNHLRLGSGSGGGGGQGGQGGNVGGAYSGAQNSARNANQGRYDQIMAMFQQLMGGQGGGSPRKGGLGANIGRTQPSRSRFQDWQNSGSSLGMFEYGNMQRQLERTAAQRGGAYGGIDARQVYPRMYGGGNFLDQPGQGSGGGSSSSSQQRPNIPPPVYPTFQMPNRPNTQY